jgi:hypothetical protein
MSQGAVLIARNNTEVDYIKQAVFCAKRIIHFLNIPVSLITDNTDYLEKNYKDHPFDKVITVNNNTDYSYKKYHDGAFTRKKLEFKNTNRSSVYDLSPYDETLVLDTDFILANDVFKHCFEQQNDFLIYSDAFELSNVRNLNEFKFISEVGPKFYWATCIFFRKTELNKIFFDLVSHIQENWSHYRNIYRLHSTVFRNDWAFSIAIHIVNGYTENNFANKMPGTMFYTTDRDLLIELKENNFLFLLQTHEESTEYFPAKIKNSNIHVMNKYSLNRVIDNA